MVSVTGYQLGEFAFMMGFTYALVSLNFLQSLIMDLLYDQPIWKAVGVWGFTMLAVFAGYMLDFRIGFVMFVNGVFSTFLIMNSVVMYERYRRVFPKQPKVKKDGA